MLFCCTELSGGWAAAVIDTEEEFNDIMTGFTVSRIRPEVWIGGSTNENLAILNYSEYIAGDSGKLG